MNRFFVEKENITDSSAVLYGEDVKHISSVLRLRTGDEVMLCDGMGTDYRAKIAPLRCSKGCLRQASLKP